MELTPAPRPPRRALDLRLAEERPVLGSDQQGAFEGVGLAAGQADLDGVGRVVAGVDLADVDGDQRVVEAQVHRAAPAVVALAGDGEGQLGAVGLRRAHHEVEGEATTDLVAGRLTGSRALDHRRRRDRGRALVGHHDAEGRGAVVLAGEDVGEPAQRRRADRDEEHGQETDEGDLGPQCRRHGRTGHPVGSRAGGRGRDHRRGWDRGRGLVGDHDAEGRGAVVLAGEDGVEPAKRRGADRDEEHGQETDEGDLGPQCRRHGRIVNPVGSRGGGYAAAVGVTMSDRLSRLGYVKARQLLIVTGLLVLAVVALVAYARGVDDVEVAGTLLFLPIFVAFVFRGVAGGILSALVAIAIYAALRSPAIDAVGASEFTGLLASRSAAYLIFGAVGGWATQVLEGSLTKLEL